MHLFFRWSLLSANVKVVPTQCNSEGGTYTFFSEVGFLQVHFLKWSLPLHFKLRGPYKWSLPVNSLRWSIELLFVLRWFLQVHTLGWSLQVHLFFRWSLSSANVKVVPTQCNSEGGTYTFFSEVGSLQVHFLRWSLPLHFYLRGPYKWSLPVHFLRWSIELLFVLRWFLQVHTLGWSLQVYLFFRWSLSSAGVKVVPTQCNLHVPTRSFLNWVLFSALLKGVLPKSAS